MFYYDALREKMRVVVSVFLNAEGICARPNRWPDCEIWLGKRPFARKNLINSPLNQRPTCPKPGGNE